MPLVSVIVPCYNEEGTIQILLDGVYCQDFPRDQIEIIIADGMSTDSTRLKIKDFHESHPDLQIRVIDNLKKTIPSGLNCAIQAATGSYIIRLDAHARPQPDYIRRCLADLDQGLGLNVGGVWEIQPGAQDWRARSIAAAASHPLGVGDAYYRFSERAQTVDTVPFGAFRKDLVSKVGLFDESLLTNEDYEFNTRIRKAGGKIWLDPAIRSTYFARANYRALARQYWRYGFWKARMLRRYPSTLRWRQALPPAFVLSLLVLLVFSVWFTIARWLLFMLLGIYGIVIFSVGLQLAWVKRDAALFFGVPLAIATMHLSWGSALLISLMR